MNTGNAENAGNWLAVAGRSGDVVVSSRVRMARNLAGFRFPNRAPASERSAILTKLKPIVLGSRLSPQMEWVDLSSTTSGHRTSLVEERLISRQHAMGKPGEPMHARAVAIGLPERRLSIMINEEDHLRLQVIRGGFDLSGAMDEIDSADDAIEQRIDYAYSPRFGYLTACPTNVGTGVRLSVMLHLPALKITREIEKVKRAADDLGLTVRGSYGEGSDATGDFYQISNQTTIGKSEAVLLREMEAEIIPSVIAYERTARERLMKGGRRGMEDQAWRAVGVLLHARLLSTEEATQLLSRLRLGIALGVVPNLDLPLVNQLLVAVQPSHIQMAIGQELTQDQRREARASLLRGKLGEAFAPKRKPPRLIRPDTPEPPAGPSNRPPDGGDR
ncbi:MAG: protein arginine kinase [Phycisphaera sp.]|nr:MAG: protein arginine kinase [Phycisphaera sp.]